MNRALGNIQHSTFNIELGTRCEMILPWMLSVECWALNVEFPFATGGNP